MNNKMKELVAFIAIITVFLSSTALFAKISNTGKEIINGEWYHEFGGKSYDEACGIVQTRDKGFIITGGTDSYGNGNWDTWLLKIDKEGNEIWNKTYGGKNEDIGKNVIEVDNGFVIGGYTESYGKGEADFWLLKVDKNGNEIWNKTYGEKANDFLNKAIQTTDGGYLMVGETYSFGCLEDTDMWIIKTDKNGNVIWSKVFGGNKTDFGNDAIETNDGYLVSGITYSYETHGGWDAWLIKIDKEGNEIWNKTYGWWESEESAYIVNTENGYMIVGTTLSTSTGWGDIYFIKIDKNGNEIWNKTFGGKDHEILNDLKETNDGYILVGGTESYDVGIFDAWLLKVDKEGNEIWNKSLGGRDRDVANSVIGTRDGKYIIVGVTGYYTKYANAFIAKCGDYPPSKIKIVRPKRNYLYIFDREILPFHKTMIIGKVTIVAKATQTYEDINKVEFYLTWIGKKYEYEPRKVLYSPPYEWKFDVPAISLINPVEITVAAYYGNAGAVAVDKIELYIINPFPAPASSSASLHK